MTKSNRKKVRWLIVASVLAVILAGIYMVYTAFEGNPVKKLIENHKAKTYVEEMYPGRDFVVQETVYDFKMAGYYTKVQSLSSEDTYFWVYKDRSEHNQLVDDYEWNVTKRQNTLSRLSRAMEEYVDAWAVKYYPYRTSLVLCDCRNGVSEEDVSKLELDMPFDSQNFPLPLELTVWVETSNSEPSWEELAEKLRELEQMTREVLPQVESFSLCVQDLYVENSAGEWEPEHYDSTVSVYEVPRSVIVSEELEAYLAAEKAAQEAELEAIEQGENPGKEKIVE